MILGRPLAVGVVATLAVTTFLLHAFVLRPRLYPAGAGFTLSGDTLMNELAEPPPVGFAHLPDVGAAAGRPVVVTNVWPGSPAERAGITIDGQRKSELTNRRFVTSVGNHEVVVDRPSKACRLTVAISALQTSVVTCE